MELHLYYSPYCPRCQGIGDVVEQSARNAGFSDAVRMRNVLEHIDEAVAAGVRTTPALTLNGRLLASGHLDSNNLAGVLEQALMEEENG